MTDLTEEQSANERPIVVIDGMNVFIRHFCVNPTVTAAGELVGGVVGFIRFIEWVVKTMSPQKIIVIWEKGGGSAKRKSIYPEYKANRARIDGLEDAGKPKSDRIMDNHESRQKQLVMLVNILKHLPICQIYHPECECDDVLAYLVKEVLANSPAQKVVISSDKDFYQLLIRDDIIIYDQAKKNYVTAKDVVEKFGIHPRNFVLARTIDGDDSDNIDGIKGVGFKTLLKAVPEIGDPDNQMDINSLLECCKQKAIEKPKVKTLQNIIDGESIIRRNWQLMYLGIGTLSALQAMKINKTLESFEPKYDQLNFWKALQKSEIVLPIDFHSLAHHLKICLLTSS
jgi:DNA polymerase-1